MIPKIIHFVWLGDNQKPQLVKNCIDSWHKFCPDYKIIEWNNDSIQDIDNVYLKQAFENKKWAFASDFVRLYALDKFGGFYFDSDLEITKNIDKFRNNKFVTGHEIYNGTVLPFTAFMGAEVHNKIIQTLLHEYDDIDFVNPDGTFNQITNTKRVSDFFGRQYGVIPPYDGTKIIKLNDDGILYPYWTFCTPVDGKENYSIHHFNGSWLDGYSRKNKIKLGHLSLVRFRKIRQTNIFPLSKHETIIYTLKTSTTCVYALVWSSK